MKKKGSSVDELNEKIKTLEHQEAVQMAELKKRVQEFKHSLAPSALVASAFNSIRDNKAVQGSILDSSAGIAAGWVLRKLLTPKSGGIFNRMGGYLLQYVATKYITNKMPFLRQKAQQMDL